MKMKPRKTPSPEIPFWQFDGGLTPQLDAVLSTLPRRNLFSNESVQVVLTGLLPGQKAWTLTPSCPILLIVTFGQLRVEAGSEIFTAIAGRAPALNPGVSLRLSATEHADFLLVGGRQTGAAGKPLKRCLKCALFNARN